MLDCVIVPHNKNDEWRHFLKQEIYPQFYKNVYGTYTFLFQNSTRPSKRDK